MLLSNVMDRIPVGGSARLTGFRGAL